MPTWIWEHTDWPEFRWRETEVSPVLARARLAQGRILGAAGMLDPALTLDADVSILVEDGMQTSAIEGERLDPDAVRSSVARHLGLPTAGLPAPSRATAWRELSDLVAKACLVPAGKGGRSSAYEIPWAELA